MVITMAAAKTRAIYALILFVLFIKPPAAILKLRQRLPDSRPVSSHCCTWNQAVFPDSA